MPVPSDDGRLGAGFYLAPKERADAFSKFDPKIGYRDNLETYDDLASAAAALLAEPATA